MGKVSFREIIRVLEIISRFPEEGIALNLRNRSEKKFVSSSSVSQIRSKILAGYLSHIAFLPDIAFQ